MGNHSLGHAYVKKAPSRVMPAIAGSFVALALLTALTSPLAAETYIVTKLADTADGICDSDCSLREAVAAANADEDLDTIQLGVGEYQLSLPGAGPEAGDLDLVHSVRLLGVTRGGTSISAQLIGRVIEVHPGADVTIANLTITGGETNGENGGGIAVAAGGSLLIDASKVSSNTAGGTLAHGGGIANSGALVVVATTVEGNRANGNGGGIWNNGGTLQMVHTTLSDNSADRGQGLWSSGEASLVRSTVWGTEGTGVLQAATSGELLRLENSTVSGFDTALESTADGPITLLSSTIYARASRAVECPGCTLTLINTLLNGDCTYGTVDSGGGNLESPGDTCGLSEASDQTGVTADALDLGELADNGGPTWTHALLDGSAAIDRGIDGECPKTDQRGAVRLSCDVGAVEHRGGTGIITIDTASDDPADGCTLREAIEAVNDEIAGGECTTGGGSLVFLRFDIEGPTYMIQPTALLPRINRPVVVDATTQPGTACAAGILQVAIDGRADLNGNGLDIGASGSTVRGLAIQGFANGHSGILLGASDNTIQCSFIGTDITGNSASSNHFGIGITGSDNKIGGISAGDRNLVSGNSSGLLLTRTGQNNTIEGNLIGTDITGKNAIPNAFVGISIAGGANHKIGGQTWSAGNLIANNKWGISVLGSISEGHEVTRNSISKNEAGILSTGGASFTHVTSNCINNNQYGFKMSGGAVDARGNWWGHPSGPSGSGPGFGDAIGEGVVVLEAGIGDWLLEPPQGCEIVGTFVDLGITASESTDPVVQGAGDPFFTDLSFTVTVTNHGPDPATNVVVKTSSEIPSGVLVEPGAPEGDWFVGDLAVGQTALRTTYLAVGPEAEPDLGSISHTAAYVSMDETPCSEIPRSEPCLEVRSVTETTSITSGDSEFSITKTDNVTTAVPGDEVTYLIEVTNDGLTAAPVVVTDEFPDELTCSWAGVSDDEVQGYTWSSGSKLDDSLWMPGGSKVTYRVTCDIDPNHRGMLTNTATVFTGNATHRAQDSDTLLAPQVDLSIAQSDSPDPILATASDRTISYTLSVFNAGPSTARYVQVIDTLPSAAAYEDAGGDGWSCDHSVEDGTVTCQRRELLPNETVEILVQVTAPASGQLLTNTATVGTCINPSSGFAETPVLPCSEMDPAEMHEASERTTVVDQVIEVDSSADTVRDDGTCTLREAMTAANTNRASGEADGECAAGGRWDWIKFNIGGPGPHTILPVGSRLPDVTTPMFIDGATQGGTNCESGVLQIELDGSALTANFLNADGLYIKTTGTTVRGLTIHGFEAGIYVEHASKVSFQCNFLGTDPTGRLSRGNTNGIAGPGSQWIVGGDSPADRNVISANRDHGIFLNGSSALVQGNLIGTDVSGKEPLGNGGHGIHANGCVENHYGGRSPASRNVISANGGNGLRLAKTNFANGFRNLETIEGNLIGTDISGAPNLPNGAMGIEVAGTRLEAKTALGGSKPSAGNLIAGQAIGIRVLHPNVALESNRVLANTTGIELSSAGSFYGDAKNCISGNTIGLHNQTATPIDANGNWWGHHTGPSGSFPGRGDSAIGAVDVSSFLDQPPPNCRWSVIDLEVMVSDSPDPVVTGRDERVTYTMIAKNVDEHEAESGFEVHIEASLPDGVDLAHEAPSAGTWADSVWSIPRLVPGAQESLELVYTVDSDIAREGASIELKAALTTAGLRGAAEATETTTIAFETDLEASLTSSQSIVEAGVDELTLTATAINHGPSVALGVEMALSMPFANLVGFTTTDWSCEPSGDLQICRYIDPLPAGDSASPLEFVFRAPNDQTEIRFEATVSATTADPGGSNDRATVTTTVRDTRPPTVTLNTPAGGEFWLLTDPLGGPSTENVVWTMSDNVRICRVQVTLLASDDQESYREVEEGLLFEEGAAPCSTPATTSNVTYEVPATEPSGGPGSFYKVRITIWDAAGLTAEAESQPFFIVPANPDAYDTLILANLPRMRDLGFDTERLETELEILREHPLVSGLLVDLDATPSIARLFTAWDAAEPCIADSAAPCSANDVLFSRGGIHDLLLDLLKKFSAVKYLLLVGDDRIIPLARIRDRTALLTEKDYPQRDEITADGTTVGRALAENHYLSDDPLATKDPMTSTTLGADLFLPDLAVGRLVETPEEIIKTIRTYFRQQGVLDLTRLDATHGNKVQVTGYDFLIDSGNVIAERWRNILGTGTVDGELLNADWGRNTIEERSNALRDQLCSDGAPYSVLNLNGHATHFEEGVPGESVSDIHGLATLEIDNPICDGNELDLSGRVVYAVGCHGGLPVPGSDPNDADNSLDLPQTMMRRGVVAYVANTGYGWGLKDGIGYGERLVQLMTEELTLGPPVSIGEAVKNAKSRYYLESSRLDPYDDKSLMQWTLFGLPMYALKIRSEPEPEASTRLFAQPARALPEQAEVETIGKVTVTRKVKESQLRAPLPNYLTRLDLHFDFSARDVYIKRNHLGEKLVDVKGCQDLKGCYYTLNGVFERGSGESDLPIQPTFIYDSRLRGTSQHGVLWKGGSFDEEREWVPVVGELASNAGDFSHHGSTPRIRRSRPTAPRIVPGEDPPQCRPSDLEINRLVIEAGEVLKERDTDPVYDIQRLYREIDLEVFYYNNTASAAGNCDRTGPEIHEGPHHAFDGSTVSWAVAASDDIDGTDGVWRVVVVWSADHIDAGCRNRWTPLELENDGTGVWRGNLPATGMSRMTYVVQAVDRRGNVTWLDFAAAEPPASGIDPDIPQPVDIEFGFRAAIFADGFESGNTLLWGRCQWPCECLPDFSS